MATEQWIILVLVFLVLGIIVSLRFIRVRDRGLSTAPQMQTRSLGEQGSQREDHRLAGMSAEDRAWEQASLQRNRDTEARAQHARDGSS